MTGSPRLSGRFPGVTARARSAQLGVGAALIGAAGLALAPGAALADAAADAGAPEVSGLTVQAKQPNTLDHGTGLAVLPSTLQDTPQTVNVIPAAQLKEQGINTLEQALRNVPGITVAIGEGGTLNGDQFKIRGFDAKDDVYVDGLRDFGVYTRDSFNYEEVQVLKGPSGAMFGRGATGGAINTISKSPHLKDETSLDGYVGNGDYYRALADINRQINATTAVRLNLMASSTGVVDRDEVKSDRWGAALSVGFGLGTDTTLVASYLHQHDDRTPDYGVTIVQPPGQIIARPVTEYGVGVSRSNFLGYSADRDRTDADILTVRLTHKAAPWLTLTSDSRVGAYSRYFQYTTVDQCNAACTAALFDNNPATIPYGGIGGSGPYDQDAWGVQNISTARIDFDVGGFKNQLIAGVDLSYQSNKKTFYAYTLPVGLTARTQIPRDLINPPHGFPDGYSVYRPTLTGWSCNASACTRPTPGGTQYSNATSAYVVQSNGEASDLAAFVTDRLWLTEAWSVIGSVRFDRYNADFDTLTLGGTYAPLKSKSNLTNPRVSVVYEPSPNQTFYLSWGRSATPQGTSIVGAATAIALTSKDLSPEISESWELGGKVGLFGGRLGLSAALFDVKKDNALQSDPATGALQAQSGERQEVKGLELGLTGKITPAWTINAAYSYLDAEIKESYSNCTAAPAPIPSTAPTGVVCPVGVAAATPVLNTVAVGRQTTYVPKNSASVWTSYDLRDLAPGLSLAGGVTWQDKVYLNYAAASSSYADRSTLVASRIAEAPQNFQIDAAATYRFDRYRVALNVYNLTDELNYAQVFANRAAPAAGRTFILSFGATF
ncbi:MAG: TonB-dependent receptor [Caulobacteraceae bacterium]|nr:TonB-dependent receptor [Caulobacteraceae bacterium]